jgi:hypothetical protein
MEHVGILKDVYKQLQTVSCHNYTCTLGMIFVRQLFKITRELFVALELAFPPPPVPRSPWLEQFWVGP